MTVFLRDRQVAPKLSNCLNNEVKNGKIEKCKNVNKIFLYNFHTKTVHLKQKNVFSSNKKMLGRLKWVLLFLTCYFYFFIVFIILKAGNSISVYVVSKILFLLWIRCWTIFGAWKLLTKEISSCAWH